jgi:hypothetical protein
MGVALGGKVERCVARVQVGPAAASIGQPGDAHLAEDGGERAGVARLHRGSAGALGVDDGLQARLALGAEVQVILEEQAEQLPALGAEAVLQLCVAEGAGPVAAKEGDDVIEL